MRFMQRACLLLGCWLVLGASGVVAAPSETLERKPKLVLLTWPDYLSPSVVKQFEDSRQVTIETRFYDATSDLEQKLVLSNGRGYDVILADATRLAAYAKKNWLAPLNDDLIPNRRHIAANWFKLNDLVRQYGVPYFWGTIGIIYREDKILTPLTHWLQLLQPDPAWAGKILMLKDSRDVIGVALKALGYSLNSTDEAALEQVAALLQQQKPGVIEYGDLDLTINSGMVTGDLWIGMAFNGDAVRLQRYHRNIQFVVPVEGTNLWLDCWVVHQSSSRKALAYDFLNFINQPEQAAQLAQDLYYATPNQAAQSLLPAAFTQDTRIYPDAAVLARSELSQSLPTKTIQRYNSIFLNLVHDR